MTRSDNDTNKCNSLNDELIDICIGMIAGIYGFNDVKKDTIRNNINSVCQNEINDFIFNIDNILSSSNQLLVLYDDTKSSLYFHTLQLNYSTDMEGMQKLLIIKNNNILDVTLSLESQVTIIKIPNDINIKSLSSLSETSVSSLFNLLIKLNPELHSDASVEQMKRSLHELSLRFQNIESSILIPKFEDSVHDTIRAIVTNEKASKSNYQEFLPKDYINDSNFLNSLQSTVNTWLRSISTVTLLMDSALNGDIQDEISFWNNMSNTISSILKSLNSAEVLITFSILKDVKRLRSLSTIISDTKLLDNNDKINNYKVFLLGLPISRLMDYRSIENLKDGIYDLTTALKKFRTYQYPVERFIFLINKLDNLIFKKLLTITPNLLSLSYTLFRKQSVIFEETLKIWEECWNDVSVQIREIIRTSRKYDLLTIPKQLETTRYANIFQDISDFRDNHERFNSLIEELCIDKLTQKVNDLYEIVSLKSYDPKSFIDEFSKTKTKYNSSYIELQSDITRLFLKKAANSSNPKALYHVLYQFKSIVQHMPFLKDNYAQQLHIYLNYVKEEIKILKNMTCDNISLIISSLKSKENSEFNSTLLFKIQASLHVKTLLTSLRKLNCNIFNSHDLNSVIHSCQILLENYNIDDMVNKWQVDTTSDDNSIEFQPVFSIIKTGNNLFELKMNYNFTILNTVKDLRNMLYMGIEISTKIQLNINSYEMLTPYSTALLEQVQLFLNFLQNIALKPFCCILLSKQIQQIWLLIQEGMEYTWGSISRYTDDLNCNKNYISNFGNLVSNLIEEFELISDFDLIITKQFLRFQNETFSSSTFSSVIIEMQAILEKLALTYSNDIDDCIVYLNVGIKLILTQKIRNYIIQYLPSRESIQIVFNNHFISSTPEIGHVTDSIMKEYFENLKSLYYIPRLHSTKLNDENFIFSDLHQFQDTIHETTNNILHILSDLHSILLKWKNFEELWYINEDTVLLHIGEDINRAYLLLSYILERKKKLYELRASSDNCIMDIIYVDIFSLIEDKLKYFENILINKLLTIFTHNANEFYHALLDEKTKLESLYFDLGSLTSSIEYVILVTTISNRLSEKREILNRFSSYQDIISSTNVQFPSNFIFHEQLECTINDLIQVHQSRTIILENNRLELSSLFISEKTKIEDNINNLVNDWNFKKKTIHKLTLSEILSLVSNYEKKALDSHNEIINVHDVAKILLVPIVVGENKLNNLITELNDYKSKYVEINLIVTKLLGIMHQQWKEVSIISSMKELKFLCNQLSAICSKESHFFDFPFLHYTDNQFKILDDILEQLSDPSIKDRHWTMIFKRFSDNNRMKINIGENQFTLEQILSIKMLDNIEGIKLICNSARQEYVIEASLNSIKQFWQNSYLSSHEHSSGLIIVEKWDDLYQECKDHIDELNSMKSFSYYNIFKQDCTEWEDKLDTVLQIMDIWMEVQYYWLDLYGIIGNNNEIRQRLPLESSKYDKVTSDYKDIIIRIFQSSKLLDVLQVPQCFKIFSHISGSLKLIKLSLIDFINKQRTIFPRFNFLSNEDILRIIGSRSGSLIVSVYMQKMYGTIKSLLIKGSKVLGIVSIENEELLFCEELCFDQNESNFGWLSEIDNTIERTIKTQIESMHKKFESGGMINEFFNSSSYQALLVAFGIYITAQINNCIESQSFNVLSQYLMSSISNLLSIFKNSDDSLVKLKVNNILVEFLHYRDFVNSLSSFSISEQRVKWLNHLKFYFFTNNLAEQQTISISINKNNYEYQYQYIGVPEKLIYTTPLMTAFVSLTDAFSQSYGSSLFGPAATGKTETAKSLGYALGKTVIVFNCDESFDIDSLTRIMRGICHLGAWCCFDEFNRLPKAILSAVASYLEEIQVALHTQSEIIKLRSITTTLNGNSRFIVTLNPDYDGRFELPSNLKKLFRPFSMPQADILAIISVYFELMNYSPSNSIAENLIALLVKLENGSTKQKHYDFGLRCIKSIIKNCIQLTRVFPSDDKISVLVKSIMQVLSPKLNQEDNVLLKNLVTKVFNTNLVNTENSSYVTVLQKQLKAKNIFNEQISNVCSQLYDLQKINQSIILMGYSGVGKSTIISETLDAIKCLQNINTFKYRIDTKVLSKENLYGFVNKTTQEWHDGIFTAIVRDIINDTHSQFHNSVIWIIFDSDIDPEYAEVLNSVLDDNRLLTLPTGERLNIPPNIKFIFETQNLDHTTMATISRCALIWISKPVYSSFLHYNQIFQDELSKIANNISYSDSWYDMVINPIYQLLTEKSLINIFEQSKQYSHVLEYSYNLGNVRQFTELLINQLCKLQSVYSNISTKLLDKLILYSIERSLIISLTSDSTFAEQILFVNYIEKELDVSLNYGNVDCSGENNLLNVYFDSSRLDLFSMKSLIKDSPPEINDINSSDSIVETITTERYKSMILDLLDAKQNVILCGPPGSGKTMLLTNVISNSKQYLMQSMSFSKATKISHIINILNNNCIRKISHDGLLLSPKIPDKVLILFFDEINLIANDQYGSQPVILFLRQLIQKNGFWDTDTNQWVNLHNIGFVGACNPTNDLGRSELDSRFLRITTIINVTYPEDQSLHYIYRKFFLSILRLTPEATGYIEAFTEATISVYRSFIIEFPSKYFLHYIVSPRDLTRLMKGIYFLVLNGSFYSFYDIILVWMYECQRVFYDRLVSSAEKNRFLTLLKQIAYEHFPLEHINNIDINEVLFSNWLSLEYKVVNYLELSSVMNLRFKTFCEETVSSSFVLHKEFFRQTLSVERVLNQYQGHMMLIGPHKTGKSTIVKFVCWMNGIEVIQLNIHKNYTLENFDSFLRNALMKCAIDEKRICVLIDETNLTNSIFFERMNSLLAKAEISDLFQADEYDQLLSAISNKVRKLGLLIDTEKELYSWFIDQVSKNLHIIFEISKNINEKNSLLASPAMFNRCVVLWSSNWEYETKVEVIQKALQAYPFHIEVDIESIDQSFNLLNYKIKSVLHVLMNVFLHIEKIFKCDSSSMDSPSRLLNTLSTFVSKYSYLLDDLEENQRFMSNGLDKLNETVLEVKNMRNELNKKKHDLILKEEEANKTLDDMLSEQNEAERKQDATEDIKELLEKQNEGIKERRDYVIQKLSSIKPMLENAENGVKGINKAHLVEIKSMNNPPASIKLTLEVITILLGRDVNSWNDILQYIRKDSFISDILNFDTITMLSPKLKDFIVEEYFSTKTFNYEVVNRASKACGPLFQWIQAQLEYCETLHNISPLQNEVKSLENQSITLKAKLSAAQDMIVELEDKIVVSKKLYSSSIREIEKIKGEMQIIEDKLCRSIELIESLNNEKDRWVKNINLYSKKKIKIIGDSILSAVFICYCSQYDEITRNSTLEKVQAILRTLKIPFTTNFSFENQNIDKISSLEWTQHGLPSDKFYIENFDMIVNPPNEFLLIVDPNDALSQIILNYYGARVNTFSFLDQNYIKRLENSIRFGEVAFVHDAEHYDPILDNIISKNYKISAGRRTVMLGDREIDISSDFKLILHTRNYNYEISTYLQCSLRVLNFKISSASIKERTINLALKNAEPNIKVESEKLLLLDRDTKLMLKTLGSELLNQLGSSKGSILENQQLIETLADMRIQSAELENRLVSTEKLMYDINQLRQNYSPLSLHSSLIFKLLENINHNNWYYETTVEQFLEAVESIFSETFDFTLIDSIDRLIDKLYSKIFAIFSVGLKQDDVDLLIISLYFLKNVIKEGSNCETDIEILVGVLNPRIDSKAELPKLTFLSKLLDIIENESISAVIDFCRQSLTENISTSFDVLTHLKSNINILIGNEKEIDGTFKVKKAATELKQNLKVISLGDQSYNSLIEEQIIEAKNNGDWILLQNLQLSTEWVSLTLLKYLEPAGKAIVKDDKKNTVDGFKLFMTCDLFDIPIPVPILQKCYKYVCSDSSSIIEIVHDTWEIKNSNEDEPELSGNLNYFYLKFLLTIFHSLVISINKLTGMGFTKKYDFNNIDFEFMLQKIVSITIDNDEKTQDFYFEYLRYMLLYVIYGAKIDNNSDLKKIKDLLSNIFDVANFPQKGTIEILPNISINSSNIVSPNSITNLINNINEPIDSKITWLNLPQAQIKLYHQNYVKEITTKLINTFPRHQN